MAHVAINRKMATQIGKCLWSIHAVEYHSEIRMDELQIHIIAWIHLKNTMLKEKNKSLTQKVHTE